MPKTLYGDLYIDPGCAFAERKSGEVIKFSRYERALLRAFLARPGLLLTRQQLLDSIHEQGSDSADRNIDYLLSRLRRKLGDSSRTPRYIATQYGEGYTWIAKPKSPLPATDEQLYLSVGPLHYAGTPTALTTTFLANLTDALETVLGSQRIAVFPADQAAPKELQQHYGSRYSLEVSVIDREDTVTFTIILVDKNNDQVMDTFRKAFPLSLHATGHTAPQNELAASIKERLWEESIFRSSARGSTTADPLSVGMYKASTLFDPNGENFLEVEQKLRQRLADNPDDHRAAIMLVANLYAQFNSADIDHRREWRPDSERLIFEHLAGIQNEPLYLAYAAERLSDLGHHAMAEKLADQALDIGPGFAACYMVVGRIKVHRGATDEGIAFYDHSLSMAEESTLFYRMLLTMKALALLAEGRRVDARQIMRDVIAQEPDLQRQMIMTLFFFTDDPQVLTKDMLELAQAVPVQQVHNMALAAFHLFAQPFQLESARVNIFGPGMQLLVNLHGREALPDEVRASMPGLFANP